MTPAERGRKRRARLRMADVAAVLASNPDDEDANTDLTEHPDAHVFWEAYSDLVKRALPGLFGAFGGDHTWAETWAEVEAHLRNGD